MINYKLGETRVLHGIKTLQVYKDSLLVVNLMKGLHPIQNVDLQLVASHLKEIVAMLERFSICHIYRQLNKRVDAFLKMD
jgi:hypothetical protein